VGLLLMCYCRTRLCLPASALAPAFTFGAPAVLAVDTSAPVPGRGLLLSAAPSSSPSPDAAPASTAAATSFAHPTSLDPSVGPLRLDALAALGLAHDHVRHFVQGLDVVRCPPATHPSSFALTVSPYETLFPLLRGVAGEPCVSRRRLVKRIPTSTTGCTSEKRALPAAQIPRCFLSTDPTWSTILKIPFVKQALALRSQLIGGSLLSADRFLYEVQGLVYLMEWNKARGTAVKVRENSLTPPHPSSAQTPRKLGVVPRGMATHLSPCLSDRFVPNSSSYDFCWRLHTRQTREGDMVCSMHTRVVRLAPPRASNPAAGSVDTRGCPLAGGGGAHGGHRTGAGAGAGRGCVSHQTNASGAVAAGPLVAELRVGAF
jgi:hypothetical protein